MSLTLALNNALTGLRVNQRTMAVISNNIANANTEGYSRQVVDLESVSTDGVGSGVRVEEVVRKVDKFLQSSILSQSANFGEAEAIQKYFDNIQVMLGEPGSSNSLDEYIDVFFNNVQQLAETPERTSSRAAVVDAAITLSREISNMAEAFEELRFEADREISQTVTNVNNLLRELQFTNEAIANADAFGSSKAGLLDERDLIVGEISSYIDVHMVEKENSTVHLYAGSGFGILEDNLSQLTYSRVSDITSLIEGNDLQPIMVQSFAPNGDPIGLPQTLVSSGVGSSIERRFNSGELGGLMDMRDTILPDMLNQLDEMAANLRDTFNAIHNSGSGYPGATEMTGTTEVRASDRNQWQGSVRIAALNENGTPLGDSFSGDGSLLPLTMDLTSLNSGGNFGEVDMQTFIDEFNNHFGNPQNRLSMVDLNNVQLAVISDRVPANNNIIDFDFDIENISGQSNDFWVEEVTIFDDMGVDIGVVSNSFPTIALADTGTFITTAGSNTVTVRTQEPHGLFEGEMVRLNETALAVDGIPAAEFGEYFTISNVTPNGFDITVTTPAIAGGSNDVAAQSIIPPNAVIESGGKTRLQQLGNVSADISANNTSNYYDAEVKIAVRDAEGNLTYTTAVYRIESPETDTMNDRISARSFSGVGELEIPQSYQPIARAFLVDENGLERPNFSGDYDTNSGFLRFESLVDGVTLIVDELDSQHLGIEEENYQIQATNRGFSHYYGLNNFFAANEPTADGESKKNSALNLDVSKILKDEPSLISTGNLQLSNQSTNPADPPVYTYERFSGDQSVIAKMAQIGVDPQSFAAAGGLPASSLTFVSYAAEFLGFNSANAIASQVNFDNSETLLEGYTERAQAISGVNLDEELANTVIYQNAYSASARVISVTDELFETLIGAI